MHLKSQEEAWQVVTHIRHVMKGVYEHPGEVVNFHITHQRSAAPKIAMSACEEERPKVNKPPLLFLLGKRLERL